MCVGGGSKVAGNVSFGKKGIVAHRPLLSNIYLSLLVCVKSAICLVRDAADYKYLLLL